LKYVAISEDGELSVEILDRGDTVVVNGQAYHVDMYEIGSPSLCSLLVDNRSYEILIEPHGDALKVLLEGRLYNVRVEDEERHRLSKLVRPHVTPQEDLPVQTPMPGMVVSVAVKSHQRVTTGDLLVVLESMKMENELRAPRDGVVRALSVAAGDLVEAGQVLLMLR
jgi:acetyl/propionyl-CoA carboxylase alpha subunit